MPRNRQRPGSVQLRGNQRGSGKAHQEQSVIPNDRFGVEEEHDSQRDSFVYKDALHMPCSLLIPGPREIHRLCRNGMAVKRSSGGHREEVC